LQASASGGYNIASCEISQNPVSGQWVDTNAPWPTTVHGRALSTRSAGTRVPPTSAAELGLTLIARIALSVAMAELLAPPSASGLTCSFRDRYAVAVTVVVVRRTRLQGRPVPRRGSERFVDTVCKVVKSCSKLDRLFPAEARLLKRICDRVQCLTPCAFKVSRHNADTPQKMTHLKEIIVILYAEYAPLFASAL
jgi:hypothetical protein